MLHKLQIEESETPPKRKSILYPIIFGIVTAIMSSFLAFNAAPYTHNISFFQDEVIEPVPDNFSAPLEVNRTRVTRKEIIGFLPSWSVAQEATVYPEYLDQLLYFGIGIDEKGNLIKSENDNIVLEWHYFNSGHFQEIVQNARQKDTKILVVIKNFDNESIDTLISNPAYTKNAIAQINQLIEDYELDGVNIDFEYFTRTDFPTLQFYNTFLQQLSDELRKKKPDVIISFDVNASAVYQDNAYDMVKIGELMDQVIIMGYDYHRTVSTKAGSVSPISAAGDAPSLTKTLDSLRGRVPAEKIILGVPLYGYEWQTYTEDLGSNTIPQTGAIATYKRVRELIEHRDDVSIQYDEYSQTPWLVYNQNGLTKQIHYEDEKSLAKKIELIHDKNLQGMALWALGYEGDYIEPWIVIKDGMWTK